ncbi:hypothetical protein DSM104299_04240 [Baekduia alba]|uniref:hypothetical protein n=1 Tax=Baekduia alba TaxID=2997333 RepID=UPI00233FB6C5|nr:hypothetical protein [Baekduia alba]WCB95492.1 hypothetical protein DSM104299_04240 [Baekduia alba]
MRSREGDLADDLADLLLRIFREQGPASAASTMDDIAGVLAEHGASSDLTEKVRRLGGRVAAVAVQGGA